MLFIIKDIVSILYEIRKMIDGMPSIFAILYEPAFVILRMINLKLMMLEFTFYAFLLVIKTVIY